MGEGNYINNIGFIGFEGVLLYQIYERIDINKNQLNIRKGIKC